MSRGARLLHLAQAIMPGDAISHSALALHRSARARGLDSRVYARWIDASMRGQASPIERCRPKRGDILLYHFGVGSELTEFVCSRDDTKLVLIYHNLTPPHYFRLEDPALAQSLEAGREQVVELREHVDLAIADSAYSAGELSSIGYSNPAVVPPVYLDSKYEIPPDEATMESLADHRTNLLFVSRIAPNKKQEDVIKAFYFYRRLNPDSRLLLVGPLGVTRVYYRWLRDLVDYLGLPEVHFTDRVSQSQLNAYYRSADVFVSMSEHEGFGMFLVESMHFDVPIIAYGSAAIPDTLGDAGVLLKKKDLPVTAELIHLLLSHDDLRQAILENQRQRLKDFARERIEAQFWACLAPLL
jgi:glycosyltransferase involved in cell wall biosynthesis